MNDTNLPTPADMDTALSELEALMPRALAVDVVSFEQLTSLYVQTLCLKLRLMK